MKRHLLAMEAIVKYGVLLVNTLQVLCLALRHQLIAHFAPLEREETLSNLGIDHLLNVNELTRIGWWCLLE